MDLGLMKAADGPANGGNAVIDATTQSFGKDVLDASRSMLVIVDFWAAWCGPCKQLTPILEKVVNSYGGKVRLVKVDVDHNQAVAAQLRVQSLPTVYAFRDGRPVDGFMGAQPESVVKAFVERLFGEDAEADLAAVLQSAEKAFEEGDLQGAAEIYAAVLQEDRENVPALAGLAQCYLKSGDVERARQVVGLVPPDKANTPAVVSVIAALDLASKAVAPDERDELADKVARDPSDLQARLDLAVALAARGEKAQALEHLLDLVRRDRKWNDEAARKQLVQFFEAWGPKEDLTIEGRRRLSSILFS